MDLPRGQFECIIHTFCVLSLPRPTRLFSRQTTAKCVHMFDSGIRNFNQNHIERAYAARARKKRFLKSDRKEKGAQIELKKCFLNYTNVTHGIPVSWNIQALPLSLLFLLFFFFLFLLHFGRRVTLRTLSFAQIAWPATPSKRDECKWAGKDLGVSRLFFFWFVFFLLLFWRPQWYACRMFCLRFTRFRLDFWSPPTGQRIRYAFLNLSEWETYLAKHICVLRKENAVLIVCFGGGRHFHLNSDQNFKWQKCLFIRNKNW